MCVCSFVPSVVYRVALCEFDNNDSDDSNHANANRRAWILPVDAAHLHDGPVRGVVRDAERPRGLLPEPPGWLRVVCIHICFYISLSLSLSLSLPLSLCVYIYIYIYIYREREIMCMYSR